MSRSASVLDTFSLLLSYQICNKPRKEDEVIANAEEKMGVKRDDRRTLSAQSGIHVFCCCFQSAIPAYLEKREKEAVVTLKT